MIIVNLKGGLGNQMFQYALGRALSIKAETDLVLDMTFLENQPSDQDHTYREYQLDIFKLHKKVSTTPGLRSCRFPDYLTKMAHRLISSGLITEKGFHFLPEARLLTMLPRKVRVIREKYFHFDSSVLSTGDNVYLEGFWQGYKYFSEIASLLKKDFAFSLEFDDENRSLSEEILSVNSVCLNIRRTDFVTSQNTNSFHGVCEIDYFQEALQIVESKIQDFQLYVFTDDIPWCRENLKTKHPIKIVGPEYYGPKYQYKFRHMTLCRHFVIPNSTFGWWRPG